MDTNIEVQNLVNLAKQAGTTPSQLDRLADEWMVEFTKRNDSESVNSAIHQANLCRAAAWILRYRP